MQQFGDVVSHHHLASPVQLSAALAWWVKLMCLMGMVRNSFHGCHAPSCDELPFAVDERQQTMLRRAALGAQVMHDMLTPPWTLCP